MIFPDSNIYGIAQINKSIMVEIVQPRACNTRRELNIEGMPGPMGKTLHDFLDQLPKYLDKLDID